MDLQNKVAIVTGGSRGIGKATTKLLLENGCSVVINSRTQREIDSTVKELSSIERIVGVKADVSSSKDVKKLVDKTIKEFGRIDILVNNAGVLHHGPLSEMTEKEWDETIDTNLKGIFLCSNEVMPYMAKRKTGVIVNIGSGASHHAFSNLAAYSATKFGVLALTSALADEIAKYGIKVFSVCPGAVATEMQDKMMPKIVGKFKYKIVKHLMTPPEKIGRKILELCENSEKLKSGSCFDVFF